jgi:hypothetical protein
VESPFSHDGWGTEKGRRGGALIWEIIFAGIILITALSACERKQTVGEKMKAEAQQWAREHKVR